MKHNLYKKVLFLLIIGLQIHVLQASNESFDEPFDDVKESRSLIFLSTNNGEGDESEYFQEFEAIRNSVQQERFEQLARRDNVMMCIKCCKQAAIKYDAKISQKTRGKNMVESPVKLTQDEPGFYFADKPETASQEKQMQSVRGCMESVSFCNIS